MQQIHICVYATNIYVYATNIYVYATNIYVYATNTHMHTAIPTTNRRVHIDIQQI